MIQFEFTDHQIEFLVSKGFRQDPSQHSGFFFIEEDGKTYVLIPYYGTFKMEVYEVLHDGDSGYYENMYKIDAESGQSLQEFLNGLSF
jgi:hypothetical protein